MPAWAAGFARFVEQMEAAGIHSPEEFYARLHHVTEKVSSPSGEPAPKQVTVEREGNKLEFVDEPDFCVCDYRPRLHCAEHPDVWPKSGPSVEESQREAFGKWFDKEYGHVSNAGQFAKSVARKAWQAGAASRT